MPFFVEPRKLVRMFVIKLGIFLAFLHDIGKIRNIYSTLRLNSQKTTFSLRYAKCYFTVQRFTGFEFETSVDFKSLLPIDFQGFTVTYQNVTLAMTGSRLDQYLFCRRFQDQALMARISCFTSANYSRLQIAHHRNACGGGTSPDMNKPGSRIIQ